MREGEATAKAVFREPSKGAELQVDGLFGSRIRFYWRAELAFILIHVIGHLPGTNNDCGDWKIKRDFEQGVEAGPTGEQSRDLDGYTHAD